MIANAVTSGTSTAGESTEHEHRTDVPAMSPILSINKLTKGYASGQLALREVNLQVRRGEIFALLGPNGAGKTTLINIVCGIVTATSGSVALDGHDIVNDYRYTRSKIGLVPQELTTDAFETVWATVAFSRGLFGLPQNREWIQKLLGDLSLRGKQHDKIMHLSGGMKRRVMIAKALSHEPELLFLDEPSAGVDVELRRDMWTLVKGLRDRGVTIVLTTHYIQEAEEMADRIGVIAKGELVVVEEKTSLLQRLGQRRLTLALERPLAGIPAELADLPLSLRDSGRTLELTVSSNGARSVIPSLLRRMSDLGIAFQDLDTHESSLEEIFVNLIHSPTAASA